MIRLLDKLSLIAMASGVGMMLQPWWAEGFRAGFFVTLIGTVLQVFVGRFAAGAAR